MVSIHLPVGTLRCETIAPLRGVRSSIPLPQSEIQMIPNHNQKTQHLLGHLPPLACYLHHKKHRNETSHGEKKPLGAESVGFVAGEPKGAGQGIWWEPRD